MSAVKTWMREIFRAAARPLAERGFVVRGCEAQRRHGSTLQQFYLQADRHNQDDFGAFFVNVAINFDDLRGLEREEAGPRGSRLVRAAAASRARRSLELGASTVDGPQRARCAARRCVARDARALGERALSPGRGRQPSRAGGLRAGSARATEVRESRLRGSVHRSRRARAQVSGSRGHPRHRGEREPVGARAEARRARSCAEARRLAVSPCRFVAVAPVLGTPGYLRACRRPRTTRGTS